ncbi:hypothetical protein QBC40DRAFT_181208 [Triangularia verruculosa]|uniref:Uncharacterized protein n=1 Tax=Triangularia verruculosa TaxID=2587418 RepID=A0AAN7AQI2_9PEZI|nr:hypothetical protein QBC40DRAFT_181208 [Triangularia verruculosa]
MPPKRAPIKKAFSTGGRRATVGKATVATTSQGEEIATSSTKKDGDAKDEAALDGFPLFRHFATEIQQEIFTQAIRKPGIHYMAVKKKVVLGYTLPDGRATAATWKLIYAPRSTTKDGSSHRLSEKISKVNRKAQQAVELANQNKGQLPFSRAWSLIDVKDDLVVFDFAIGATRHVHSDFRYFHIDNQIFAPFFDAAASYPLGKTKVIEAASGETKQIAFKGLADVKKIGLFYKQSTDRICRKSNTVFQCCIHTTISVGAHKNWIMCPEEVAGFIDSLPSIEQLYFLIQPNKKWSKQEEGRIALYKKWFFSCKFTKPNLFISTTLTNSSPAYHEQLRTTGNVADYLTMFHDADKTYIEVDRFLMLPSGKKRRIDLEVVKEARDVIKELKKQLVKDGPDIPQAARRNYRSSYAARQAMVIKILLPVDI